MGRRSSTIVSRVTELHERGWSTSDITDWLNKELRDELGDKRLTDRGVTSMIQTYQSHREKEPVDLESAPPPEPAVSPVVGDLDQVIEFFKKSLADLDGQGTITASSSDDEYFLDQSSSQDASTNRADAYREYLGTSWDSKSAQPQVNPGEFRRVVAVGDFHGRPNAWIAQRIIAENPDVIVIGGDMLDSKQASPHPDTKGVASLTIREEVANCRAFLEKMCDETHAEILVMRGNHDDWINRKLQDADLMFIVDLYGDVLNLLMVNLPERVRNMKMPLTLNVPIGSVPPEVFAETPYLMVLGDAMMSHINFSAKNPGDGVKKFTEWIYEWHRPLGLPEPSLCIQFHGHKSSLNSKQGGWLRLVEPGMAGDPSVEDYKVKYQGKWHPGSLDGCYFEQILIDGQWHTDQGSVRLLSSR